MYYCSWLFLILFLYTQASFQKARYWVKELQKHASSGIVLALVGNKVDLEDHREVETSEAAAFAGQKKIYQIQALFTLPNSLHPKP